MRRKLLTAAILTPLAFAAAPAMAVVQRPPAGSKPLSEIVKILEDAGFTPVEVDFKAGRWHVEAFNSEGQKRDLRVHPVTGEITSNRRS